MTQMQMSRRFNKMLIYHKMNLKLTTSVTKGTDGQREAQLGNQEDMKTKRIQQRIS